VHVDDVMRLVDGLDRGLLDLRFYRGICCYSFPVQAAEFFLRREMKLDHLADLKLSRAVRTNEGTLEVTFDVSGRAVTAGIRIKPDAEGFLLTCKSAIEGHPPRYELLSLGGEPTNER
jgi:hypothetical protein